MLLIFLEIKHIFWPLICLVFSSWSNWFWKPESPNHKMMWENLTLLSRVSRWGHEKTQSQQGFFWRSPVPPAVCPALLLKLMLPGELHRLFPGWSVFRTSLPLRWICFPVDRGMVWGCEMISCRHPVPPCPSRQNVEWAWALWFRICCLNLLL